MPKTAWVWNGVLLALLWGRAAWIVSTAPASVPTHFDFAGRPDSWGSPATLFLMPLVATFLTAMLLGIGAALPNMARNGGAWINVPRKAKFVALPAEARVRVVRPLSVMLACLPIGFMLLFLWIIEETARFAVLGRESGEKLPWFPMLLPIVGVLVAVALSSLRVARMIEAEHAASTSAAGEPPVGRGRSTAR